MFDWIYELIANAAYDSAINSAGCASCNGAYQLEEPESLQRLAKNSK